jgi:hypothetical protein
MKLNKIGLSVITSGAVASEGLAPNGANSSAESCWFVVRIVKTAAASGAPADHCTKLLQNGNAP